MYIIYKYKYKHSLCIYVSTLNYPVRDTHITGAIHNSVPQITSSSHLTKYIIIPRILQRILIIFPRIPLYICPYFRIKQKLCVLQECFPNIFSPFGLLILLPKLTDTFKLINYIWISNSLIMTPLNHKNQSQWPKSSPWLDEL